MHGANSIRDYGSGMVGGAAVAYAMPPAAENPVTTARNRIAEAVKRVIALRDSVEHIADLQLGPPGPSPVGANSAKPNREGEAGRLHDDLDVLHDCLDSLHSQVNRLAPLGYSEPTAPSFQNNEGSLRRIG